MDEVRKPINSEESYSWPLFYLFADLDLIIITVCVNSVFFYLVCEAIVTAATPGLLCQPRVVV
jgi:hypothetical protein